MENRFTIRSPYTELLLLTPSDSTSCSAVTILLFLPFIASIPFSLHILPESVFRIGR